MPVFWLLGITALFFIVFYALTRQFVSRRILVVICGGLLFALPTIAWLDWVLLKYESRSFQTTIFLLTFFGLPAFLLGAINALILRTALVDCKHFLPPVERRRVGTVIISFLVVLITVFVVFFLGGVLTLGDPAGIE